MQLTVNTAADFNSYAYKEKVMRLLLGVVLVVMFAVPASAGFQSQEDVTKWITFYYQKPDPTKIPDAIEYMSQSDETFGTLLLTLHNT